MGVESNRRRDEQHSAQRSTIDLFAAWISYEIDQRFKLG